MGDPEDPYAPQRERGEACRAVRVGNARSVARAAKSSQQALRSTSGPASRRRVGEGGEGEGGGARPVQERPAAPGRIDGLVVKYGAAAFGCRLVALLIDQRTVRGEGVSRTEQFSGRCPPFALRLAS